MSEIKEKAGLPSERLIKKLIEKFPAFASAELTERAKKEGAWESDNCGTGYYFTSKAVSGSSSGVEFVDNDGLLFVDCSNIVDAGLRVALQTIYNPKSNPAKGWRIEKRTAKIWNEKKQRVEEVTSEAPIVTVGKKEYIWLNKEECDNGTATTRELISLKLLVKAKAFDADGNHNDYGKADPIRKQCEEVVLEDCTEEERATIIEVKRTDKDGYESATPILRTKEQQEWQDKIKKSPSEFLSMPTKFFADEEFVCECVEIAKQTIREETVGLEEVPDEYVALVKKQLEDFSKKIEDEKKAVKEQDAKAEKTSKNRASVLAMLDGKGEGK